MILSTKRAFTWLMAILSLISIVGTTFGWNYYATSHYWDFKNTSYLGFNQAVNFTSSPHQGVLYDSSLVGYWALKEGSGVVAHDSSGNGNNGTIYNAAWTQGKFGDALSFNGISSYVSIPNSATLSLPTSFSISLWFDSSQAPSGWADIIGKRYTTVNYGIYVDVDGNLHFEVYDGTHDPNISTSHSVCDGLFHYIVAVRNGGVLNLYVDGILVSSATDTTWGNTITNNGTVNLGNGNKFLNGIIDEVCVYNRALSTAKIAALYIMGPQPDIASFANYYSFIDPVTNNTMLIHVINPNASSNNVALVTCTDFFAGNRLSFRANNSATVNVWTSLGQPAFTTGVWNSQNYTTTLALNDTSNAELNWNTCNITTYTDAHSSASPSNETVAYGENFTLNFSATQGYNFKVAIDGTPKGQINSYTFNNVTTSHVVKIISTQIQPFPVEALIAVAAMVIIVAVFALAFKKGYITIEVVDDENPQETKTTTQYNFSLRAGSRERARL